MRWAEVKAHLQSTHSFSQYLTVDEGTLFRLSRTLSHFYRREEKDKGNGRVRVFYKPNGELKRVQSLIHKKILLFAPYHDAIHGYRKGRSQRTAALPHIGKAMLLKADIQDYFPNISPTAVYSAFRQIGIPDQVSRLLVKLCTYDNQLPQGSPASPLISNLIWARPARRTQGFVDQHKFGHTISGDDVFVSGPSRTRKFKNLLKRIIREEGFTVNEQKTQSLPYNTRQVAAGLVVNAKLNVNREYRKTLRREVHDLVNQGGGDGVASIRCDQKARLTGKIGFVKHINPVQGQKLQREFERIKSEQ